VHASVARLETRLYLGSQLLRDIDAMSMAHSLEVRVPLVDHVLLDAVWPAAGAFPRLLKNKRLLYETLALPLRPSAFNRTKGTFTLPFNTWMHGPLGDDVRGGMEALASSGWIARDLPARVWHGWQTGEMHWSRPWTLGILGRFLSVAP
jgi:asparagine synthase (glutamine-hydrolysing)